MIGQILWDFQGQIHGEKTANLKGKFMEIFMMFGKKWFIFWEFFWANFAGKWLVNFAEFT